MNPANVVRGLQAARELLQAGLVKRGVVPASAFDDESLDDDPVAAEARLLVDQLALGITLREVMREAMR